MPLGKDEEGSSFEAELIGAALRTEHYEMARRASCTLASPDRSAWLPLILSHRRPHFAGDLRRELHRPDAARNATVQTEFQYSNTRGEKPRISVVGFNVAET